MGKKILFTISVAGFLASLASCSEDNSNTIQETRHELQPLVKINLTAEQQTFVNRTNDFAFNFAASIGTTTAGNMNVSPVSTAYVLGMLLNGANGETQSQISKVLGFEGVDVKTVNEYFQSLKQGASEVDKSVKIYVSNAIVTNKDFELKPAYEETVGTYYDAKAESFDFSSVNVADKVNSWVKEETDGKITDIIGEVSPNACMYALNAVYFKGIWTDEFDAKFTAQETFTGSDGTTSSVAMMQDERTMLYWENETYSMVQLPYGNKGWSMQVLLPAAGKTLADVFTTLDGASWKQALEELRNYSVNLKLPRFEFEDVIQLTDPLQKLGITNAFIPERADFSNLSNQGAYVTQFLQKTYITVDEKGTEATTVSVAEMGDMANVVPNATFHANRPFVFLITENTTGTIYFIGIKQK